MSDEENIFKETINKKAKEIDRLTKNNEEQKKSYEDKIKNLMSSIFTLKSKADELNTNSKDNVRVNIINNLKTERKDQENIIVLLRKMISDEERVDKYLLKEFKSCKGDNRIPTYEELRIKIKQLESENITKKYKALNLTNTLKQTHKDNNEAELLSEALKDMKEKHYQEVIDLQDKVKTLDREKNTEKDAKEKLENMQNELFNQLKSYNSEIGEMKSVYNTIKENLQEENRLKQKELKNELDYERRENEKLKTKIYELVEISEKQMNTNTEKLKKINQENELLKKILEGKKQELQVLDEELNKYKNLFEKADNKDFTRSKRYEKDVEEIKLKYKESIEKNKHSEKQIKQKDFQIEQIKHTNQDLEELVEEKTNEIDLLQMKLEELEHIALKAHKSRHNHQ